MFLAVQASSLVVCARADAAATPRLRLESTPTLYGFAAVARPIADEVSARRSLSQGQGAALLRQRSSWQPTAAGGAGLLLLRVEHQAAPVAVFETPYFSAAMAQRMPASELAADVQSLRQPNERWTSVAVRRQFAMGNLEAGLEGLVSEPMPAMDRRGRMVRPLTRAGGRLGFRLGHVLTTDALWQSKPLQAGFGVRGHARRWLGHGRRPTLDIRFRLDFFMPLRKQAWLTTVLWSQVVWRQIAGEKGQVVQVGSWPKPPQAPGSSVPQVLYEPIYGHEDLARYTAHVLSVRGGVRVRLHRHVTLGGFVAATQIDDGGTPERDLWYGAAGPSLVWQLPSRTMPLRVRVQSARRTGGDTGRWLHLLTIGV